LYDALSSQPQTLTVACSQATKYQEVRIYMNLRMITYLSEDGAQIVTLSTSKLDKLTTSTQAGQT